MAVSAYPAVSDALVTLATAALPNHTVLDGVGFSGNPGDYLMIGVQNPDEESPSNSADIRQTRATMGGARDEMGEVTCCAYSWTGDSGNAAQKAARDAAFVTVNAVADILRTTSPTLGVSTVLKTEFGEQITVSQAQTERGTDCMVIFSVAYLARI